MRTIRIAFLFLFAAIRVQAWTVKKYIRVQHIDITPSLTSCCAHFPCMPSIVTGVYMHIAGKRHFGIVSHKAFNGDVRNAVGFCTVPWTCPATPPQPSSIALGKHHHVATLLFGLKSTCTNRRCIAECHAMMGCARCKTHGLGCLRRAGRK
jgi:hypothetical protein